MGYPLVFEDSGGYLSLNPAKFIEWRDYDQNSLQKIFREF